MRGLPVSSALPRLPALYISHGANG
jgi:hypothetical protein